jgi:hypothetical protein
MNYFISKKLSSKEKQYIKRLKKFDENYGEYFCYLEENELLEIIQELIKLNSSVVNLERFTIMYKDKAKEFYEKYVNRKTKVLKNQSKEASKKGVKRLKELAKIDPEFRKKLDTSSVESFIRRGFTLEEAKQKSKEKQSVGKLEKFMLREGPVLGFVKWRKRQEKWQNTLKSKSQEEIDEINRKKRYGNEIKAMIRKKKEEEGKWIPLNELDDYRIYERKVRNITNQQKLETLKNYDKRAVYHKNKNNKDVYHLDHKVSVYEGFKNNIPPYIIGNISNLEMIPAEKNLRKGRKSSITIDELLSLF